MRINNRVAGKLRQKARTESVRKYPKYSMEFCLKVFSVFDSGFGFLAAKNASDASWCNRPINLAAPKIDVSKFFQEFSRDDFDLYFCPNAFSRKQRKACYAYPTPYAHVDIDDADPNGFDPVPNFLLQTSSGRYQGLWYTDTPVSAEVAEGRSKYLLRRFGGDQNGWSVTKYLRIPYTFNHKPQYRKPLVKILRSLRKPIDNDAFPKMPTLLQCTAEQISRVDPTRCQVAKVLRKFRGKLHPRVMALARSKHAYKTESDRSKVIFEIVAGLYEAGATSDEIAAILWVNPYFRSKHGANRNALSDEISRITRKVDYKNEQL